MINLDKEKLTIQKSLLDAQLEQNKVIEDSETRLVEV